MAACSNGQNEKSSLHVGDTVIVGTPTSGFVGILRFQGSTDFANGDWMGIELQLPQGRNNGTVNGRRYFEAKDNHGLFVWPSAVRAVAQRPELERRTRGAEKSAASESPKPPRLPASVVSDKRDHPSTWTLSAVAEFIRECGFSEHSDRFRSECIDGMALLLLDVVTLQRLGLRLGDALKFHDSVIKKLQNEEGELDSRQSTMSDKTAIGQGGVPGRSNALQSTVSKVPNGEVEAALNALAHRVGKLAYEAGALTTENRLLQERLRANQESYEADSSSLKQRLNDQQQTHAAEIDSLKQQLKEAKRASLWGN